ncbi:MAG: type II secretion system protein [Dehalococcoidales bacterium]|nr:type II secretion system protein [Dehalococcoidales bacterium]
MSGTRKVKRNGGRESGFTLLESLVALAILGTIAVVFLGGVIGTTKAAAVIDEQTTAESLAQNQMEWVQNAAYVAEATSYSPAALPGSGDYNNYSVNITSAALHSPDDGVQKITITIRHSSKEVSQLEGYKLNR